MSSASVGIVKAALEYREACLSRIAERPNECSMSYLSGRTTLDLIANQAAKILDDNEIKEVLLFFRRASEPRNLEDLNKKLAISLENFYAAELKTTSENADTLVRPSGKPDSAIGIGLHCQTKDPVFFQQNKGAKSEFWDPDSQTVDLLIPFDQEEWIEKLVEKYGDDYAGMFRDRKLNPMQQCEGDIKKGVKKWKAKHGI